MASSRERVPRTCKCGKVSMVQNKDLHRSCKACAARDRYWKRIKELTGGDPSVLLPKRKLRDHSKYRETPRIVAKPHPNMIGVRYEDVPVKRDANPINGDALARKTLHASPCGNSIAMCMEA